MDLVFDPHPVRHVAGFQMDHLQPTAGNGSAPLQFFVQGKSLKSRFVIYRNRVETETDQLVGKREDTVRRVDGEWKLCQRKIILDQSVLLAKNLTFFF